MDIASIREEILDIKYSVAEVDAGNHENFDMSSGICRLCIRNCPLRAGTALDSKQDLDVSNMDDPVMMARFSDVVSEWEMTIKALKAKRLEMLSEGTEIPGYELKTMSGGKEIVDKGEFLSVAEEFMSDEEIAQIMKIDLTKAKELISSSAPRGEKEKARSRVRAKNSSERKL